MSTAIPIIRTPRQDRAKEEIERAVLQILAACNLLNAPGMEDTPQRVARMFVDDLWSGLFTPEPQIKLFDMGDDMDQVYTVGPVTVRSTCEHHLAAIYGQVYVGVHCGPEVLGLSKFARLAQWVFARPIVQERATHELAALLAERSNARGIAVCVRAEHDCMKMRGVREAETTMVTSEMLGTFRDRPAARAELMELWKAQGL
jgi:GTP cyclohydrolase I